MNFKRISEHRWFRPVAGAGLAVLCGWALWQLPLGEPWVRGSYDQLLRFGARSVTNQTVVILMDNEAFAALDQTRGQPWDRALHARLLNRLADDGCPLVVVDVFFRRAGEPTVDVALSNAIARLNQVVLAAEQAQVELRGLASARPILPFEDFLDAARNRWGVAWLDADADLLVRRHWPFPSPGPYADLPWVAAKLAGAKLSDEPVKRWLRFYDSPSGGTALSYHLAEQKPPGFFADKIVFVGTKPHTPLADRERDEFSPPHYQWTRETVGGVELLATAFLNLVNNEWLRRLSGWIEFVLLGLSGTLLAFGLGRLRRFAAVGAAAGAGLLLTVSAAWISHWSNVWFPWLIVVGGQLPVALAWCLILKPARAEMPVAAPVAPAAPAKPAPNQTIVLSFPEDPLPDAPEYELLTPHIGKGGFGKVWIARNAIGQWQALKAVYASSFGENRQPYESEFRGLQRYKPVSEKHPGLLRIELISRMKEEGYFYYVMELGDAQSPGWENEPQLYKPRDLENLRKQSPERRLPVAECLRIVTVLADALNFLHEQGLTHRDIKPSNVIFVNGRPKLADIGLVADIRPAEEVKTLVGTPGYMPPPPEPPGTPQADIYALGMLLYVISTGREPGFFPDLSTTLMERSGHAEFLKLNAIVLRACQPDVKLRYQTTAEMLRDLREAAGQ